MPSDVNMHAWITATSFLTPASLGGWEERVGIFWWSGHGEKGETSVQKEVWEEEETTTASPHTLLSTRKLVLVQCKSSGGCERELPGSASRTGHTGLWNIASVTEPNLRPLICVQYSQSTDTGMG